MSAHLHAMTTHRLAHDQRPNVGRRVRAVSFAPSPWIDDNTTVPPGIEGTVASIDDGGTVHVDWDNGSRIGLVPPGDRFQFLDGDEPQAEEFLVELNDARLGMTSRSCEATLILLAGHARHTNLYGIADALDSLRVTAEYRTVAEDLRTLARGLAAYLNR